MSFYREFYLTARHSFLFRRSSQWWHKYPGQKKKKKFWNTTASCHWLIVMFWKCSSKKIFHFLFFLSQMEKSASTMTTAYLQKGANRPRRRRRSNTRRATILTVTPSRRTGSGSKASARKECVLKIGNNNDNEIKRIFFIYLKTICSFAVIGYTFHFFAQFKQHMPCFRRFMLLYGHFEYLPYLLHHYTVCIVG